jgi:predicted ATPase/DNA-binding winged helix-turn-helix (wHTH) protein
LAERATSFGPFRLFPAQQLLLEGEAPVRLGSRALDILTALVERPGEIVGKDELFARVWPDTFVDENTLRVHISSLRRALGDGQPGRRYLANVLGRGYRFVAPVNILGSAAPVQRTTAERANNLPVSRSRALGRADAIGALCDQLPRHRFITIVGSGGIGKTTVALAVAEALLPAYEHGVRFVDLAPVEDPQLVASALGTRLGLAMHSENAVPRLVEYLCDQQMLIVLDSCEHVVETAAAMAEQLLAGAPGVHILATSRERLRAHGERLHRLSPLESPADMPELTAAEALTFPAVQLFVERASGVVDGFELSDVDAPILSDICRRLGGVALAIELAAARVDAFGVRQLSTLLDDRFRILRRGKRTAQPRHQSLAATLDWSYEFLLEVERIVLRRLSLFAGPFTLESAIAVAEDADTDVVEGIAALVAKSLVSADVESETVLYRLPDTTRAYAVQKLVESGEFDAFVRRHAQHHLDWFQQGEAAWALRLAAEWLPERWLKDYGYRIDDVRGALSWAFSPAGDASVGVALTVASIPLWFQLSLFDECRERVGCALASDAHPPAYSEADEMKLLQALGLALQTTRGARQEDYAVWTRGRQLAEKLGDSGYQVAMISGEYSNRLNLGDLRGALALAEILSAVDRKSNNPVYQLIGGVLDGTALFHLGDYAKAEHRINPIFNQSAEIYQRLTNGYMSNARASLSSIQWIQGFPDQAVRSALAAFDDIGTPPNALVLSTALANDLCLIALWVGDLVTAERWIAMLLDASAKHGLTVLNATGRCLKGVLQLAQADGTGLAILRAGLERLRAANYGFRFTIYLGMLAQRLGAAGQTAEARIAIDKALERADANEERWCMPELLRVKGEVILSDGSPNSSETAEEYFLQALHWAHRQEALSWELRAATNLARLWREAGKTAEAHELLSGVYGRFTEGFDTIDLRTARALIHELSASPVGP